jgi:RimJ/RimL family protein N-acetyltransferase
MLETTRLTLRPFTLDDVGAMHGVYGDPEVMRHVGDGPVADVAQTEAMLREYIAHQRAHGFSFWAVIERASDTVIGDAGLYLLEGRGPDIELGYTLRRSWWGRGYATEAAQALVRHAFVGLGVDQLVAVADPANPASIRVLEKLGMHYDGMREAYGREHATYRLQARPDNA